MEFGILAIITSFVASALYVPVIASAMRQREGQQSAALALCMYAIIALVMQLCLLAWQAGLISARYESMQMLGAYDMLILSILLLWITRAFLRLTGGEIWYVAGIIWVAALMLLSSDLLHLPQVIWENASSYIALEDVEKTVFLAGWGIFNIAAISIISVAYRRTPQPLYRNRYAYWLPVFILLIGSDALFLSGQTGTAGLLRAVGATLMGYVVLTHHVKDVREITRRSLIYIITTSLVLLLYIAGIGITHLVFANIGEYNPVIISGVIVVVLAALFTPLLSLVRRFVNRIFIKEHYDASRTLRDYSLSVSNIIDMEKLAGVAVGLIMDTLSISRGFLYLVDKELQTDESVAYRLRGIQAAGEAGAPDGFLVNSSPIATYLDKEQHPLLQYDIDLLPAYRKAPASEREWFKRLETEVYVPIYSRREWIGMFAFGAKLSGRRYSEEDLMVLSTLAQQTVVALENARLVENLVKLNRQLRQAFLDLDNANRSLEKIDRTKSDFISIASHELRTPLTVMRGYSDMLMDMPAIQQDEFLSKTVRGMSESTLRMNEILDSMFDIVQIDNRTLQMHLQDVSLHDLLRKVGTKVSKLAKEREQTLTINIAPLPAIKADPNLLDKMFQHLLRNAIKFTPNGGKIEVMGKAFAPSGGDFPSGGIEIIVSDTGIGVDIENRELIFTKFYQSSDLNKHSTGKSKFKGAGTGLGLALSKGIVEAHHGRIWVESAGYDEVKCPGSQFHVALPIWKADTLKEPDPASLEGTQTQI